MADIDKINELLRRSQRGDAEAQYQAGIIFCLLQIRRKKIPPHFFMKGKKFLLPVQS